jgi:hypothetical protein
LSGIIVSTNAIGANTIHGIHYYSHPLPGFQGMMGPIVEIRNVMSWLISMHIISNNSIAGNVFVLLYVLVGYFGGENSV